MRGATVRRCILGFFLTAGVGSLLHFAYELFGRSVLVAPFSAVNESTWEHMKLLFLPMLLYAFAVRLLCPSRRDFWWVRLRGIALGLLCIPVLFYTYNGAIAPSPDWLNILFFFLATGAGYAETARLDRRGEGRCAHPRLPLYLLLLLLFLFALFTFFPPHLGIFRDSLTGSYGVS